MKKSFYMLTLAGLMALPGLLMVTADAADHREAPIVNGLPQGDLGDVFVFLDPNDISRLVLILGVNGFAIPAVRGSYSFSQEFLYQFKIDNDGDFKEDWVVQGVFDGTGATQTVKVFGPGRPRLVGARNKLLRDAPTVEGATGKVIGDPKGVLVFAGLLDDSFVFDAGQFNRILGGSQDLFRGLTRTPLGDLRGRPIRADGTSGVDAFGGTNGSFLAVSFPKSVVRGATSRLNFWGTVSKPQNEEAFRNGKFVQFERTGLPAISTVFVPSAQRDLFNNVIPSDDVANFSNLIPDALTTTDNDNTGNTIAGRRVLLTALGLTGPPASAPLLLPAGFSNTSKDLLRNALLPDAIRFDMDAKPNDLLVGQLGPANGRRPQDDQIDIELRLLRELADVNFPPRSGVPGSGPARAGALDCTKLPSCPDRRVLVVLQGTDWIKPDSQIADVSTSGNDRAFPNPYVFPFLASAHPLPGAPGTTGYPPQQ